MTVLNLSFVLTFCFSDRFDPDVKQDMAQVDIFQFHLMSHSLDSGKYAEGAFEHTQVPRLNVARFFSSLKRLGT